MFKKITYLFSLTILLCFTVSFSPSYVKKKYVKIEKSNIVWKGHKITGSHTGTVKLKSGFLTYEDNRILGGEFVVNMKSITVKDLKGEKASNLSKHLKSKDFFEVNKYNTAKIEFVKISGGIDGIFTIISKVTIKDKTIVMPISLKLKGKRITTSLKLDRTKFGITYKSKSFFSQLKDKAISDTFDLAVTLQF